MAEERERRILKKAKQLKINLLSLEEAQREMSKRLLSGWTMLDKTCPISEYPLISKDGETFSVRCMMPVQVQGSPSESNAPPGATSSTNSSVKEQSTPPSPQAQTPVSDSIPKLPSSDEKANKRRSRDAQSSAIADKLLQGWMMMEEVCPVTQECPLMKDPTSGRLWSAALDSFVDDQSSILEADEQKREENKSVELAEGQTLSTDHSQGKVTEQQNVETKGNNLVRVSREMQSKALAEKMLQGWKMLAEECPSGECPLMLDPVSGRKFSVAFDSFIDEEPVSRKAEAAIEKVKVEPENETKRIAKKTVAAQESISAKGRTKVMENSQVSCESFSSVQTSLKRTMEQIGNQLEKLEFTSLDDTVLAQGLLQTFETVAVCYERVTKLK